MSPFIPILILDENETPTKTSMTLQRFLEIIEYHRANFGTNPNNVFVQIDVDDADELAYVGFYVKRG